MILYPNCFSWYLRRTKTYSYITIVYGFKKFNIDTIIHSSVEILFMPILFFSSIVSNIVSIPLKLSYLVSFHLKWSFNLSFSFFFFRLKSVEEHRPFVGWLSVWVRHSAALLDPGYAVVAGMPPEWRRVLSTTLGAVQCQVDPLMVCTGTP